MTRRFVRVEHQGAAHFAEWVGDELMLLDDAPYRAAVANGVTLAAHGARLLPPVEPTKIVCIGRNYKAHAAELGNDVPSEPLLFLKPPSALIGPSDFVELPSASQRVEHEVELGLVIGRRAQRITAATANEHVFGFTIVGDITARDLQRSDKTWARGKGFDTFCPTGPWLVTDIDVSAVDIRCSVNGSVRQQGNTRAMVFSPAELIAYISHVMTLEPGDLVVTGTPEGVGPLVAGDEVVMTVDGLGELAFGVRHP